MTELIECEKSEIVRRVSLPARDLRILGPVFSYSSNILVLFLGLWSQRKGHGGELGIHQGYCNSRRGSHPRSTPSGGSSFRGSARGKAMVVNSGGGSNGIVPALPPLRRMRSNMSGSLVSSTWVDDNDVEDLEMLLEAYYFMQLDGTRNKILSVREYIDDTEDYVNIQLDNQRNELIQLQLTLTIASFAIDSWYIWDEHPLPAIQYERDIQLLCRRHYRGPAF